MKENRDMADDQQPGFEYQGVFYPWAVTSFGGKELILIDRITGMALDEFQEVANDATSSMRGTTLLALMAISVRAKFPQWSPERIYRMMLDIDLDAVTFVDGDEQDGDGRPPEPAGQQEPAENSESSSEESSSSATRLGDESSETSVGTLR